MEVKSFAQLPEKVNKLLKDFSEAKSQLEAMETKVIHSLLISGEKKSNADFDIIMKVPTDINFKTLGSEAKQIFAGKKCASRYNCWKFFAVHSARKFC